MNFNPLDIVEWVSVASGIVYVILAARERRAAWLFGIASTALAIALFVNSKLYSESILYTYYVIVGFYAYITWGKANEVVIRKATGSDLVKLLFGGVTGAGLLGYVFSMYTDADLPWFDALTTSFSFIATFMTAKKLIENWLLWIAVDIATIVLYSMKELYWMSGLMAIYTIIAIYGYLEWNKRFRTMRA